MAVSKSTNKRSTTREGPSGSILDFIGNTPLVKLNRMAKGGAEVRVKLEFLNPGGSIKDRIALSIIQDAEAQRKLSPGKTIVEATAGNMGVSLAVVATVKGYRCILVMPENTALEQRRRLLRFGAEIVLSPAIEGMGGAITLAEKLAHNNPGYYLARQFDNPANIEAHRRTTALEILTDTGGKVDAFVAGIGTGGTITGVGQVLKQKLAGMKIIGVEPASSPLLSSGKSGRHRIPGIGTNFVPPLLKRDLLDEIITVTDTAAQETVLQLAREEGIWAGISGGANVWASLQVAKKLGTGKIVVTVLPDSGERYWNQFFSGEESSETQPNMRGA